MVKKKPKTKQVHVFNKKENGKNNTGRPTDYKKEYNEDILNFFKNAQEKIYYEIHYHKPSENHENLHFENLEDKTKELKGWVKSEVPKIVRQFFPTFQRRSSNHDVHWMTVTNIWTKEHKEFSDTIGLCKQIQESILIECWLTWVFNNGIAQLLLKNNFNYKDAKDLNIRDKTDDHEDMEELSEEQILEQLKIAREKKKKH